MSTAFDIKTEAIFCGVCMRPIEACNGRWSDWMHVATRTERCEGSTSFAQPETMKQRSHRYNLKRHSTNSTYLATLGTTNPYKKGTPQRDAWDAVHGGSTYLQPLSSVG